MGLFKKKEFKKVEPQNISFESSIDNPPVPIPNQPIDLNTIQKKEMPSMKELTSTTKDILPQVLAALTKQQIQPQVKEELNKSIDIEKILEKIKELENESKLKNEVAIALKSLL